MSETSTKSPMKAALLAEQVVVHVLNTVSKTGIGRMYYTKEKLAEERLTLIKDACRMILETDIERDS